MDIRCIASRLSSCRKVAIYRTPSLSDSNVNYDEFVDWAFGEAKKLGKIEKSGGNEFLFDGSKLIVFIDGDPAGYLGVQDYKDGYQVSTIGVKPKYRSKGLATLLYKFVLRKGPVYSDKMQTPEARKAWVKFFNSGIDIVAVDTDPSPGEPKTHPVSISQSGDELEVEGIEIYEDNEPGSRFILKMKG